MLRIIFYALLIGLLALTNFLPLWSICFFMVGDILAARILYNQESISPVARNYQTRTITFSRKKDALDFYRKFAALGFDAEVRRKDLILKAPPFMFSRYSPELIITGNLKKFDHKVITKNCFSSAIYTIENLPTDSWGWISPWDLNLNADGEGFFIDKSTKIRNINGESYGTRTLKILKKSDSKAILDFSHLDFLNFRWAKNPECSKSDKFFRITETLI